ncbi:MAG TPA: hypothetical protein PLA90_13910, partial [Candidatus Sumerlaeota bacterium]|nr:hypothetical protein [Candidatus Sumerlaeota bacterium]
MTAENGTVIKSPSKTNFRAGETSKLTATPAVGYHFTGWSGSTSGTTNPLTVAMDSSKTLTAHFAINEYALTVQAANGSVTRVPEQATYSHGTTVSLTAIPDKGFWFDHWTGDVPVGLELANPLNLTVNSPTAIQPIFEGQIVPEVSSFKINNGAPATVNPVVTLPNVCGDATSITHSYMASESADFTSATWKPYASVPLFTLSDTTGTKTVYFKVKDSADVESAVTSDTIELGGKGLAILAWGDNEQNQCVVPSPNGDFLGLAGGGSHSLGLKSDGSIVGWGKNDDGQCVVPTSNSHFVAVAGGAYHSLALKSDGSLVAWGSNLNSMGRLSFQGTVPESILNRDFVKIVAGSYYNLALKSDGSVVAWGDGSWGQCKIPEPNRDFVALAAGGMHGLGLKSDGTIVAWGNNKRGQCTVPEPNTSFVAVAAGGTHSLGLKSDGSVVAWGNNSDGQCSVPVPNDHFVGIAAIGLTSLGLKSDGSIVVWGLEATGQYQVPAPNSLFSAIARGENHLMGLTPNGMGNLRVTLTPAAVVSVGAQWRLTNETADLWHNSGETIRVRTTQTLTFKEVYGWVKPQDRTFPVGTDAQIEILGDYHRTTWTLSTACDNDKGKLLIFPAGTVFPHETTVTLVVEPKPGYWFDHWTGDVPSGWEHINPLILTMDAHKVIGVELASSPLPPAPQITSFSLNNGAVSTANPTVVLSSTCGVQPNASPAHYLVSESADFTSATWQPYMPLALFHLSETTGTRTVYFKVSNSAGVESDATSATIALWGEGFPVSAWGNNNPLQCSVPATPQGFWASAGGDAYSVGLKSDGSVVTWGRFLDPLPAPNRDFVAVAGGDLNCVALKSDGSLAAWKMNWGGQSSVPSPNRNFVSVSVGYKHCLGLKSDGSVVAWGENGEGQCSVPLPNRNFVAVAAGDYHSLGLKSDGSVVTWGANGAGECNVPLPNSEFLAVAAGNAFSLGLKSDGSILAWGANGRGQCQVPVPNQDFVAVAAGHDFSVGLKSNGSILVWGNNDSGQCSVPTPNSGFISISGAGDHVLALAAQGSLEVSLAPPEAVASGARWRLTDEAVDIWHDETVYDPVTDTSSTILKARTGIHTLTFENITGWKKPKDRQVELMTGGIARVTGMYERLYYPLLTTGTSGTILVKPMGSLFEYGTTVTLTAQPDPGTWFDRWTGDVPAGLERINPLTLVMDTTRTIGMNLGSGPPPAAPVVTIFSINHGLATTVNPTVTLPNVCAAETSGSAVQYQASESADFTSATWQSYVSIPLFR